MIRMFGALSIIALMGVFVLGGCSSDGVTPTQDEQNNATGLVRGDINAAGSSFEITVRTGGSPNNPVAGPFLLRGSNIQYVDSLQALSVDLSVVNRGSVAHNEPIGLTFVTLLPDSVTVLNPDNDEHGAGAAIVFQFANDDGKWTPGEESFPRTVLLGVGPGVSIGFVARLDIGMDETGGAIGGIVWNDTNEDGVIDPEEFGVAGVVVYLEHKDAEEGIVEIIQRTLTASDGSYRFDGLRAGFYEVSTELNARLRPTTPTVIDVILVEANGEVSDFLLANFGVVVSVEPAKQIEIGDYVEVTGYYDGETDHLIAKSIEVWKCATEPPPPDTLEGLVSGNLDHDWDSCPPYPCQWFGNELRGPATEVDREAHALEIMGSWVRFAKPDTMPDDSLRVSADRDHDRPWGWSKWLDPDTVEVGDRVRTRVIRINTDPMLFGFALREWTAPIDKVHGRVEELSFIPEDPGFTALGVTVGVTTQTEIEFHLR
jgi:hypothetical protein